MTIYAPHSYNGAGGRLAFTAGRLALLGVYRLGENGKGGEVAGDDMPHRALWNAAQFIDTLHGALSDPMVMDAPSLSNAGQDFIVWLRHW